MNCRFETLKQNIQQRFGTLPLSAMDNVKLLVSVLTAKEQQVSAVVAYGINQGDSQVGSYCVCWRGTNNESLASDIYWINCGVCNSYRTDYTLLAADESALLMDADVVEVTFLPVEQLHLLFMQYAHFDHC